MIELIVCVVVSLGMTIISHLKENGKLCFAD